MIDDDGVVRTFETGPSDPPVFTDGPGTRAETTIAAPLETVWALVSDIELPARFSEEFVGAGWTGDERGVGASFTGRNTHPAIGEWEVECFVLDYEEGRVFEWGSVSAEEPGARWRFELTAGAGDATMSTDLRFVAKLGPGKSGTTAAIEAMPDKESRIIQRRIGEVHANMVRTVDGIRELAESAD